MNNSPELYILIGLPLSGKTTFAEKVEWYDSFFEILKQLKNKQEFEKEFLKLLGDKKSIILDRPNLDAKYRIPLINLAKEFGYKISAYYFNVDKKTIEERYKENQTKNYDEDKINRMFKFLDLVNFDKPSFNEGYDEIIEMCWNKDINDYQHFIRIKGSTFEE